MKIIPFSRINFGLTSVKQTTLSKQRFSHQNKNICHKCLVQIFAIPGTYMSSQFNYFSSIFTYFQTV